jgi:hypothetical protein
MVSTESDGNARPTFMSAKEQVEYAKFMQISRIVMEQVML